MPFPRRVFPGRVFPPRLFPPGERPARPREGYTAAEPGDIDLAYKGPQLIRQVSMIPVPVVPDAEVQTHSDLFTGTPFGYGVSPHEPPAKHTFSMSDPPLPTGDVTFEIWANAPLSQITFWVEVILTPVYVGGGDPIELAFWNEDRVYIDCLPSGEYKKTTIPLADWLAMVGTGTGAIRLDVRWFGPYLGACADSFVQLLITYAYGEDTTANPAYVGWRSLEPVLQQNGTGEKYLWGDVVFDPVLGGLVVRTQSADKVHYSSPAPSSQDGRDGDLVSGYGARAGDKTMEARSRYFIRGTVVAFNSTGDCPHISVP